MELQRQKRLDNDRIKTAALRKKVNALQAAKDGPSFVNAADDMALYVIGEGSGMRALASMGRLHHAPKAC